MIGQRGGFVLGVVVGLLVGLSIALGVALYITKAPVPFVNKVPQRTAEQDQAEQQRNRNWDPNAPLAGKGKPPGTAAPASAAGAETAPAVGAVMPPALPLPAASGAGRPAPDPAAILAGATVPGAASAVGAAPVRSGEPFVYFVQTGAYSRAEEAEQQRARLALIGHSARITEREQGGRVVYRVRLGPFETRTEADGLQLKLQETKITSQLVRVERP
jgi:cell division protein FtsN